MIFTFVDFSRTKYGDTKLPIWADALGWTLSFTCISPIIFVATFTIVKTKLSNPTASFLQVSDIYTI